MKITTCISVYLQIPYRLRAKPTYGEFDRHSTTSENFIIGKTESEITYSMMEYRQTKANPFIFKDYNLHQEFFGILNS